MVPYVKPLNLIPIELIRGKLVLELVVEKHLTNHVGVLHAGAISTFLETLAGGVIVTSLKNLSNISVLVSECKIKYHYPGIGKIKGEAFLTEVVLKDIESDLEIKGKATPTIESKIYNEDKQLIATGLFIYSLKKLTD